MLQVPAVLLANKSDLTDQRVVTDQEVEQLVKEAGFAGWHAVSAKVPLCKRCKVQTVKL